MLCFSLAGPDFLAILEVVGSIPRRAAIGWVPDMSLGRVACPICTLALGYQMRRRRMVKGATMAKGPGGLWWSAVPPHAEGGARGGRLAASPMVDRPNAEAWAVPPLLLKRRSD